MLHLLVAEKEVDEAHWKLSVYSFMAPKHTINHGGLVFLGFIAAFFFFTDTCANKTL